MVLHCVSKMKRESKTQDGDLLPAGPAEAFVNMVARHLNALEWKVSDLVKKTEEITNEKVDPTYFGKWNKNQRGVSRSVAIRLAVAFAHEYAKRERENGKIKTAVLTRHDMVVTKGWAEFDWTLSKFLATAGLASGHLEIAEPTNVISERLEGERLQKPDEMPPINIGWVPCEGWAEYDN